MDLGEAEGKGEVGGEWGGEEGGRPSEEEGGPSEEKGEISLGDETPGGARVFGAVCSSELLSVLLCILFTIEPSLYTLAAFIADVIIRN